MANKTFAIGPANSIFNFIGGFSARFYVESGEIKIGFPAGKAFKIDCFDIGKLLHKRGLLFSSISLPTDAGRVRFQWLKKSQAADLYLWLLTHLHEIYSPYVITDATLIKNALSIGYLREDTFKDLRSKAQQRVIEFGAPPQAGIVDPGVSDCYEFLVEFAYWSTKEVKAHRQEYLDKCRKDYKVFFDTVESHPLTQIQSDACIIDERNNLVLAGAGTGKTSTIIGRAGFLVQSGQAKPSEILLLTFARKAADELAERIASKFAGIALEVKTFHKLGKEIIAAVEGAQPSVSAIAEDEPHLTKHVNNWLKLHLKDKKYRDLLLSYFANYLYPRSNPFELESEGEYFDFIIANGIRTLKGEPVKGIGECLIANHLFKLGIEYVYEPDYEYSTRTLDFRQYQPDFYLPEFAIYIEHFGIARDGSTAPYIDQKTYHESMDWKRSLHKSHGTTLIETFYYEHMEDTLLSGLERKLLEHGVVFDRLPAEAELETLAEFGAVAQFSHLLASLVKSYKGQHFENDEVSEVIRRSREPDQMRAALALMSPILEDYEEHLKADHRIDFDDMIGKALTYVIEGKYINKWKFILVDEFQDISAARARLLIALRDSSIDCSLFCVGDDWQSIYRFAGSDVSYTTNFTQKFGTTAISALDRTFRFNNSINDIAEKFVLENPSQLKKHITTEIKVDRPAISLMRAADSKGSQFGTIDVRIVTALDRISLATTHLASVYLLSRFNHGLPSRSELISLNDMYPKLSIDAFTIHASKGKEADYVLVLGLETGEFGFPSLKVTHPLLEALLPPAENFAHAEERRLFYVAITRARNRVYLVSDMAVASEFVVELLNKKYPIELDEFEVSISQKIFQKIRCKQCKTGTLTRKEGANGIFYGCNHFPLCKHSESGCNICHGPMEKIDRFKVCVDQKCRSWVPICPLCDGEMTPRKGRFGEFWGCRNFRGDERISCRHTEQTIQPIELFNTT